MTPETAHSPASSVLLVRTPAGERSLSAGRSYYIGRDPQSDIAVNDSRVSWRHAVLRQEGNNWLLEDVGSTNGTFQGRDRVQRVTISGSCAVRLGHPDDGPAMSCSVAAPERQADGAPGRGAPTRYVESPGASPAPPAIPAVNRVAGDAAYAGAPPAAGYVGAAPAGAGFAAAGPAGAGYAAPPGSGYGARGGGYGDGAPG